MWVVQLLYFQSNVAFKMINFPLHSYNKKRVSFGLVKYGIGWMNGAYLQKRLVISELWLIGKFYLLVVIFYLYNSHPTSEIYFLESWLWLWPKHCPDIFQACLICVSSLSRSICQECGSTLFFMPSPSWIVQNLVLLSILKTMKICSNLTCYSNRVIITWIKSRNWIDEKVEL